MMRIGGLFAIVSLSICSVIIANGQQGPYIKKTDPKQNRKRGIAIVEQIRAILKSEYYDRTLKGIDIEKRSADLITKIKTLDHNWQIYREIAQLVSEFEDSHTYFWPPDRAFRAEYGFSTSMIGEKCVVVDVKKGSDAELKGIKVGDEVLKYGTVEPNRVTLTTINYIIYGLDPQETLSLTIRTPSGEEKFVLIQTKFLSPEERRKEAKEIKKDEYEKPYFCKELNVETIVCKMRTFSMSQDRLDRFVSTFKKYKGLILDLRGNGGGDARMLERFMDQFFAKGIEVGTDIRRGKSKTFKINGTSDSFKGGLGVLIDSESASAAELFAKVIVAEKRGTVYGDRSAGAVMLSTYYGLDLDPMINLGVSSQFGILQLSIAEFIAADGSRIEGIGVEPHVQLLPTSEDLFNRRDPVLSYVAKRFGVTLSGENAGAMGFLMRKIESGADRSDSGSESKK